MKTLDEETMKSNSSSRRINPDTSQIERKKRCGNDGHPNADVLGYNFGTQKATMHCNWCGSFFYRGLTQEERTGLYY